jgi:beta-lactamase regulating signal transducer with metallopeptidase domain/protocatechuate 3,4-dioxygenase beta subunit/thiol-disulfide isomerase/thioredoxin
MIDGVGTIFPTMNAAFVVAIDVAIKATILLSLTYAVHAGLRRRRALARSAVWCAALIGLMFLPLASVAFPRLLVGILPAEKSTAAVTSPPVRSGPIAAETGIVDELSITAATGPIAERVAEYIGATEDVETAVASRFPNRKPSGAALLLSIYLGVALLLAIRLGVSLVAARRMVRRCGPVEDPAWVHTLESTCRRLGITRSVMLLKSARVSVPLTIGWLYPVIIVPETMPRTAVPEIVDMVLLHELAHVRRGDFGWNVVCKLVRLFYWPHPLVWPVGRILCAVREQACDDLCVHGLGGAAVYRAALLDVASGLVWRPEPSVGLALARATNLARRLGWIDLSRGSPRCVLSLPARAATSLAVVMVAGVLGSVELERRVLSAEQTQDAAPQVDQRITPPPTIEIVVVAKDSGKPLPGATVRASIDHETSIRKSDRDGVVRFDLAQRTFQDSLNLDVWADGYVQQRHFFDQNDARYPKIPARFTAELLPGEETLGGKVTDTQGQPIAGVTVKIWGYLGEKKDKYEFAYMVDATTDAQGNWRSRSFRSMTFAYLFLSHPDYLCDGDSHPRAHERPRPDIPRMAGNQPLARLRDFSDVQVMTAGVSLTGKVTDEHDKPIAGAEVGWLEEGRRDTFHDAMPRTSTNASGRFRFAHVRPGKVAIQVKAKGHAPALEMLDSNDVAWHVTVKLGPARALSGRAEDSTGKPIPDVFVNIDLWHGFQALGVFLKTDGQGRFHWNDAPSDAFLINASRPGFAPITRHRVAPDDKEITFILKRSLSVSGRVTDAATDKPIDQAYVQVGVPNPKTGEIAWTRGLEVFSDEGTLWGNIDVEQRPEFRLRITSKGYEPLVSRVFRRDEHQAEYDAKLTKVDRPQGVVISSVVRRPDGQPLAGALVALTYPLATETRQMPTVRIKNGELQALERLTTAKTDAFGRFSLAREPGPAGEHFGIIVVHPDFYAEVSRAAFEADSTITARPWGRVDGGVKFRGKPVAGASIRYSADRLGDSVVPHIWDSGAAIADDRGRFVLERVVPGDVRVARDFTDGSSPWVRSNGELLVVRPGETARAHVGRNGRPVVARIVPPTGFDPKASYTEYSDFDIESDRPDVPYPKELLAQHDASTVTWAKEWWASAQGHEYRRKWYSHSHAKLQPDGSIRVDDLPPGDYRLKLRYSADPLYGPGLSADRIAYTTKQFTIPEMPGGRTDSPLDLGVLRPQPRETLTVGHAAPSFDVEMLDGKRLKLEDFRGKYLLLDFWATWCGPCIAEIPGLIALRDRFGKDERFAILSLSLDASKDAPRKFVAEKAIPWKQGFLGEWVEGGVQERYHVDAIPAFFLIGPDGTLLAQRLRGAAIESAVANALRKP